MLTDDKLAELDKAERAATPAPWKYDWGNGQTETEDWRTEIANRAGNYDRKKEAEERLGLPLPEELAKELSYDNDMDLDFIALARNSLRELLDEVLSHRNDDGSFWKEFFRADNEKLRRQNAEYLFEADKLRAELVAARDAMANVMDMLDKGILVRDISLDAKPDFHFRMISLVQQLKEFSDTIKRIDDTLGDGNA